jgi:hypothetical protein
MSLRDELLKRIEKKQAEIREHEDRIREATAYIQGLQDTLKLVPKEDEFGSQEVSLRHGSNIAKARDALKAAGKPLHITEILKAIGQPSDKKHRLALGGSIAAYARKDMVFTKPAPNTFGLVEFETNANGPATSLVMTIGSPIVSGTGVVK